MTKSTKAPHKPRASRTADAETTTADPTTASAPKVSKLDQLVALMRQPGGASIEAMTAETGWQAHSVRGAISGAIKKKLGLTVISEKAETGRRYRIAAETGA